MNESEKIEAQRKMIEKAVDSYVEKCPEVIEDPSRAESIAAAFLSGVAKVAFNAGTLSILWKGTMEEGKRRGLFSTDG